ncbi:MAG TPA: cytochrome c, partial [Bacillus sp. (in: firmicutes)]|nr:cytochrome c [Bacillus sp. (in: firmicutes)]
GGAAAPALIGTGLTPEEVADIAKNGTESGKMPAGMFKGTDEELTKLSEFISSVESK